MGLAATSAVRADEAYGSLGGAFSAMGGARKLKKKPVLVLDPEELAKAHQLFQIGASEQLGEFDPRARVTRTMAEVFGVAQIAHADETEDDDYVAPLALAEADEEEEPEDELPPIDLDALMASCAAEDEAEEAWYREEAALRDAETAAEPATEEPAAEEQAETSSPADALARIISRAGAAARTAPAAEPLLPEPVALPEAEFETEAEAWVEEAAEAERQATADPADLLWPDPVLAELSPEPEPDVFETPIAGFAEASFAVETPAPPQEGAFEADFADMVFAAPPVPEPTAQIATVIGEEGTRSALRARLVREDLTLARPEPSPWRKLVNALRRWWRGL